MQVVVEIYIQNKLFLYSPLDLDQQNEGEVKPRRQQLLFQ